jgi:hypothetical protein
VNADTPPPGPAGEPLSEQVILCQGTNEEFLTRFARPGCVGLSGGPKLADRVITRAERHLDGQGRPGRWSHAFLFEGLRADGQHWVIESDLQFNRRHIRLGVQENRLAKYFDASTYGTLAVLDFGLTEAQVGALLREGLELVAARVRYSLRELLGTYLAFHRPEWRQRENPLARDASLFCSAFVQHLFRKIGLDLAPGLAVKHTTPEDLSRTPLSHLTYLLERAPSQTAPSLARRVRRLRARLRRARGAVAKKR